MSDERRNPSRYHPIGTALIEHANGKTFRLDQIGKRSAMFLKGDDEKRNPRTRLASKSEQCRVRVGMTADFGGEKLRRQHRIGDAVTAVSKHRETTRATGYRADTG